MGFTHYWERSPVLPVAAFNLFLKDAKLLASKLPEHTDTAGGYSKDLPLELAGFDGNGKPKFTKELVGFNGKGEELSHETFLIQRTFGAESWENPRNGKYCAFCKTARKPYDLMVVACLFAAQHRFGTDFEWSSDGDPSDLQQGYDFWLATCKPETPAPLLELVKA